MRVIILIENCAIHFCVVRRIELPCLKEENSASYNYFNLRFRKIILLELSFNGVFENLLARSFFFPHIHRRAKFNSIRQIFAMLHRKQFFTCWRVKRFRRYGLKLTEKPDKATSRCVSVIYTANIHSRTRARASLSVDFHSNAGDRRSRERLEQRLLED